MPLYQLKHPRTGDVSECYLSHYEKGKVMSFKDVDTHDVRFCITRAECISNNKTTMFDALEEEFLSIKETGGYFDTIKALAKVVGLSVEQVEEGCKYMRVAGSSQEELVAKCTRIN